jgi:hypothetical protein
MFGSVHPTIPVEMNRSEQVQKPVLHRSYFVLDNIPSSDYIGDERPGRRPNPTPLIDIVKSKRAMLAPVKSWKLGSFAERIAA